MDINRVFRKVMKRIRRKFIRRKPSNLDRRDVCRIDIQEGVYLLVYWKLLKIGKGPAVNLNVFEEEVLKFDCFGEGDGHYHVQINGASNLRIYFIEESALRQIERTSFELKRNLKSFLKMNSKRMIRTTKVDQEKLELAVDRMKKKMYKFLNDIPQIQGI